MQGVPVVRELLFLFHAFAREEAQRGSPEAVRPAAIAPNALREALHDLDPCLFSVGNTSPSLYCCETTIWRLRIAVAFTVEAHNTRHET